MDNHFIDLSIKHKGGGLRVLRLCDSFDLFRDGRQIASAILV